MFRFKYHYCKRRMVAYINGELSPRARRRVARYIDECDDCYAEYMRQRGVRYELEAGIPAMGQPSRDQLDRIWSAVRVGLTESQPTREPVMRYSVLAIALLVMLVVPLVFGGNSVTQAAPTQPSPRGAVVHVTPTEPSVEAEPVHVVVLTGETQAAIMPEAAPQRTPTASR